MTKEELVERLERASVGSLKDFRELLDFGLVTLGLTSGDVSDVLPIARSTVDRWRRGVSAPRPFMRRVVFDFLLRKARES